MYHPKTLAHEIYLGRKIKKNGRYRTPIISIWHVDPEKQTLGCRRDDSCGWFSPPYSEADAERIKRIAERQYSQIFAKTAAIQKGEITESIYCHDQDLYGAIYWSWRAISAMNNKGWQYGNPPSAKELDEIYCLTTNPVDNFQSTYINSLESYTSFLFKIWHAYRRVHRPWYKHPRWHIHHWEFQLHPLQRLLRRYWDKCSVCGKRGFRGAAHSDWDGTKRWHAECESYASAVKHPSTTKDSKIKQ